jgi:uridine phosphorylase
MYDPGMIINPTKEKGEPGLPAAGLLVINPAEAQAAHRMAVSRNGRQHFLFNSRLTVIPPGPASGSFFVAGPAVGAPMAVLTLEKLVALGTRHLIVYGWCGSLHESLHIGDLLLPTWSVSTEGTSAHYPVGRRPESDPAAQQLLADRLRTRGLSVRSGPVWTTDAPYRESTVEVDRLGKKGILGVDMEFGALVAAAAFRKVRLNAVLLVSDELWSGEWQPGFRTRTFKEKSSNVLQFLADFCPVLAEAHD